MVNEKKVEMWLSRVCVNVEGREAALAALETQIKFPYQRELAATDSNNDYDNDGSDNCDYNFGTFDDFWC